ncbi:MAG: hypothetical protein IPI77_16300 [Saprospiraceae bacterium]|nr:hypothetical protein [Saprospiraceae bacterium]
MKTVNPLQVALAKVLGYRWPAESDTEMELADESKLLIEAVKAYDHLSDEDGIFSPFGKVRTSWCIPYK